jgi:hypothetical protein
MHGGKHSTDLQYAMPNEWGDQAFAAWVLTYIGKQSGAGSQKAATPQ